MAQMASLLGDNQVADFNEFGYLRIQGLLSREEAERYRQLILAMVPRDLTIPFPWKSIAGRIKPYHEGYGDQETRYGYEDDGIWDTPELIPLLCHEGLYGVARELIGTSELRAQDGTIGITLRNDDAGFSVGALPRPDFSNVTLSQPLHIDPSVPEDVDNFSFLPTELQVGGLFYLTDVEPGGGGITVVPGGHKLVQEEALAARSGGRQLHHNWKDIAGFPAPVEVTGEAGNFIMTHYLLPHAASHNRRERARVAYFIRFSRLDHPFYPPPLPGPSRYNGRQLAVMTPLARRLLGLEPW
jgi:hypothetical protein